MCVAFYDLHALSPHKELASEIPKPKWNQLKVF